VPAATPVPTPTPPDFNFYKSRADVNLNKGEYTLALADYDKAVSMKSDSSIAYLSRGRTHLNLKDFTRAGADFEKSIELDPKDAMAFLNRGMLNEKLGNLDKAAADYQKAADLDPANEAARAGLKKVRDEITARAAPPPAEPAPPVKAPESVNLGNLAENALKLVKPIYSPLAQKANIEGKVVVEVELDDKGNVSEAKAVSGHQFLRGAAEDAAKRSKFKPGKFEDKPIKATGTITYNFSLKGDE
jgi:TonB family protein